MPLQNPIRLEIQKRLSTLLGGINEGSGYHHNMLNRVYRGRTVFGDETSLPAISILEAPIPLDQVPGPRDNTSQAGGWEIVVQGWVKDDKANPTDPAHVLLADVKRRLALERLKTNWDEPKDGILGLGQFVTSMYIGPGVVRPPDEISAKAYFWLTITLDIAENMAEPYDD